MSYATYRLGRRAFVVGSAALAACTHLPGFAAGSDAPRLILCDRRYLPRLTPAERAAPHVVFDGDLTRIWIERLEPMLRQGPTVIAGIASPAALFCLEQLARGERHHLTARTALTGATAVRFRIAPVGARGVA